MKKSLLFLITLIATASISAQITITHNNSQTVVSGLGLNCQAGGVSQGINTTFGVFDLENDFGIVDNWRILAVETGVEQANNLLNGSYPLFIAAYTTDDGTPNGNLVFLGGDTLYITSEDELSVVNMPFPDNVIVPAGATIVISVESMGDGQSGYRMGATNVASNDDTWGYAPNCGVSPPRTLSDDGFSDRWHVLNVIGDVATGLNEILSESLRVYPNPSTGLVNIDLPAAVVIRDVQLYDLLGNKCAASFANNRLDLSDHAEGSYLLVMQTSEGLLRKSIVKK